MGVLNPSWSDKLKERLHFVRDQPLTRLAVGGINWRRAVRRLAQYDDAEFIRRKYEKSFGYPLDLSSPQSFNEKLQWLKLRYRDPRMTQCADKWGVRAYVAQRGFGHLLNGVYGVFDSVNDLDLDNLPSSFVLKATHGSGWNIVCFDKRNMKWRLWKLVMRGWLKQNLYVYGREWVYQDIPPKIICERLLSPRNGELADFKFFCLNGKVEFIQVTDNEGPGHRINLYDKDWRPMDVRYALSESSKTAARPAGLVEMLRIAETLSEPFPFARVDLYDVDDQIVFGEITFFPSSGFRPFDPHSYDVELGRKLTLPAPNFPAVTI